MSQLADLRIACVGSGIMGGLLVKQLVGAGAVPASNVVCSDKDEDKLAALAGSLGVRTTSDNAEAAALADVVIVAVPPPAVLPVLAEVAPALGAGKLVISVAAGVTLAAMERAVPEGVHLARVMPNTPSLVGEGMNTFVCAPGMPQDLRMVLDAMLEIWGESLEIDEGLLNAFCALLAVGPTYLFPMAGQLIESAQAAGISASDARVCTAQLFVGVGALLRDTDADVDALLNMISMQPMDAAAVRKLVGDAYCAVSGKLADVQSKLSG
ncbi:MAG: prephenate dehydrogenase/arogenate dehydrogenase family protein [Armatimonadetes bacterium]|nr:prephenate dehydrogenase/arogenate dehydrogenase family protein [Armatimonadota bacterium]